MYDGCINEAELKKLRFNINDLLEELRLNGCHDISDVAVAVLETSGKLSVIPKDKARPVTVEDLQLENVRHDGLPCVIVSDGTLNEGELTRAKKDHIWLTKELKKRNIKSCGIATATYPNYYFQENGKKVRYAKVKVPIELK